MPDHPQAMESKAISPKKYLAFISYRHADNKAEGRQWATWLHQALETYEIPTDLVGTLNGRGQIIPQSIYPIFRDEVELPADSDLSGAITRALDATETLIVLCSPRAVASTYVADEIDYFKRIGGSNRIVAAIIDGEPNASWDGDKSLDGYTAGDECFPHPLQFEYTDDGQPTTKHAEPIAADFRLNTPDGPLQGWTSKEAYRQALKEQGLTDSKELEAHLAAYEEHKHLMLLKIVASVIGVPLNQLTHRDKAYQLEKEKARNRALIRWFSVVGLLAIFVVLASFVAYQNNQQTKLAQQSLRVTEIAKNIQSARQAVDANKTEAAIDWLSKNLPEGESSKKVLPYLMQGYLRPDELPNGVLQESQLYGRNWEVLLYQKGELKPIATGKPQVAYLDACTQRALLGYDQTPNPRLQVFDLASGQMIVEKVWEGERRYFDGPVVPVGNDAYLVPTVQAGSYAGANIEELFYLPLTGEMYPIAYSNPSYSDTLNEATIYTGWDHKALKNKQDALLIDRIALQHDQQDTRLLNIRFTSKTHCTTEERWRQYLMRHVNLGVGESRPSVLSPFPLPYRADETTLWTSSETDQLRNPASIDAQYYAVDYATGSAYPFSDFLNWDDTDWFIGSYSQFARVLAITPNKTIVIKTVNAGSGGIDYDVCLLTDYDDQTGEYTENCSSLQSMAMFPNFLKSNPFSRFLPIKHAWFEREKLLTVLELATGRLLPVEPIATDGLSFTSVAFSNRRAMFVGVFGSYLYTYTLNPSDGGFSIFNRAPLSAVDRVSDIISMQLDHDDNALILLKSGQLLSINSLTGLVNWEKNTSNRARKAYLVASENQSQFGLMQGNQFVLIDSSTGIALSRPFTFEARASEQADATLQASNEFDPTDLSSIRILKDGKVVVRNYAFEERPPTPEDIADGLNFSSTYFKQIEYARKVPPPFIETRFKDTLNALRIRAE